MSFAALPIRPTCWRSTPPSRRPGPGSRAAALRWWPTRCAPLAGRTQASTGEIVAIIETLQSRANQAKTVTGQSCEMIRQCVSQSERTGMGIQQIEEAVAQIADMAIQIASACGEQDAVSDELGRNVARINDSSNEVATGADHTARACLELSQLAAGLHRTMGRFRLA